MNTDNTILPILDPLVIFITFHISGHTLGDSVSENKLFKGDKPESSFLIGHKIDTGTKIWAEADPQTPYREGGPLAIL